MRVLIIGAGAVGGWLAGALSKGGAEVALLARGPTLNAIRSNGLIVLQGEQREVHRLPASDHVAELPRADAVVFAVKTNTFGEAVAAAAPALAHEPLVVTAMNGLPWWFLAGLSGPLKDQQLSCLDPGGKAAATLKGVRPLGAVVHASTRAEAPGVIRIAGVDRLILGGPDGTTSPETARIARIAAAGGVASPIVPDIRTAIWTKLWGNSNMNPVSALTRLTAARILNDPHLHQLVRGMMLEFARVGERIGLKLPMTVDERMALTRTLGDFRTSMLNDVEAGRPLEIDGLLGVVVEMAEKLGEPAPVSRAVYALARAINARA